MTSSIVIIGRNEGDRLRRCLLSLPPELNRVYVDSGSSDGSQDFARSLGVEVVDLDPSVGFTAARARNAGLTALRQKSTITEFVQMIDGDCELDPAWIAQAEAALTSEPRLAAVFGRRRERFPEASLYNQQCDDEWNVPIGLVPSCGGDVLFRMAALAEVGDYQADIIAGEEPDLCLRLSRRGWMIRRIDTEMTLHDANLLHFSQWWKRARRSGHAYAEHLWRNRQSAIPGWRRQVWSILVWGLGIPLLAIIIGLAGGAFAWISATLVALYPLQWLRLALRGVGSGRTRFGFAALIVVGKFAELGGVARFALSVARGYAPKIIEYKGSA
jgi:glycosyltransferase involved in cell wall biosynthesis